MARVRVGVAAAAAVATLGTGCTGVETLSTAEALDRLSVATTRLVAADGSLVAYLHGEVNRRIVDLDRVPQHLRDAVVAIEDQRFWRHAGLDLRAISRAALANTRGDPGRVQGGSTISQQLVKNIYFPAPTRTLQRKLAEARMTLDFERSYSKDEILEMYVNTIYLGRGAYGFQTASEAYFGKSIEDLTLGEAAFLAGIIHEPGRYDVPGGPDSDIVERGESRRRVVLDRMVAEDLVGSEDAEQAASEPLAVVPPKPNRWEHPYFVDMVLRELGVLGSRNGELDPRFDVLGKTVTERVLSVHEGGLEIHTTLDPKVQEAATRAVTDVLPERLDRLSAAVVTLDPSTGHVKALVGGKDYYPQGCPEDPAVTDIPPPCRLAKVNLALGAQGGGSGRQPGSAFKPFALAAALEDGMGLGDRFNSSEFVHEMRSGNWRVRNYEGSGSGLLTLLEATARSVNAAYARLTVNGLGGGDAVAGAGKVASVARRMGVGFATPDQLKERCGDEFNQTGRCTPADSVPATSLGAKEVSPLEMASAYGVFAADGNRAPPTSIARIVDAEGKTVYESDPQTERVLSSDIAKTVNHALQRVVTSGTGTRARLGSRPAAGKTGTSQQWRDAWFTGYVPQLVTAVWVGNPIPVQNRSGSSEVEAMVPANGYPTRIVGGSYPAVIWNRVMSAALLGVPVERFAAPPRKYLGATRKPDPSEERDVPEEATAPEVGRTVPNLGGMSHAAARNALSRAGYKANAVRECPPGGSSGMRVWRQSPGGGSSAPRGSTVTFWYSPAVCR